MGPGAFNNAGTFTKAGTGPTFVGSGTNFSNSGLVQVREGHPLFGNGSSTGNFNVFAGATLDLCNCFDHVFQPSSAITGGGTLQVEGSSTSSVARLLCPLSTWSAVALTRQRGAEYLCYSEHFDGKWGNTGRYADITVTNTLNWLNGSLQGAVTPIYYPARSST